MLLLILLSIDYATDLATFFPVSYHIFVLSSLLSKTFTHTDDHCRVKLKQIAGAENSDYINASYMDVSKCCKISLPL